jgi:hypothetical protein
LAGAVMEEVRITNSLLDRIDMTLVHARALDITGSKQRGIIVERARVQGLIK